MAIFRIKNQIFIIKLIFGTLLLFLLYRVSYKLFASDQSFKRYFSEQKNAIERNQPNTVILLSMIRSGSSILGSIFNERPNITYLFEPLFPFGIRSGFGCDKQFTLYDVTSTLRSFATCDFEKISSFYQKSSRMKPPNCLGHQLCFVEVIDTKGYKFLSRDAGICRSFENIQKCPKFLDETKLKNFCKKSLLIAMKVNHLCKLEWILPLLQESETNIKVVHLVRDPRSTVNSRTLPRTPLKKTLAATFDACGRLAHNLPIGDMMMESELFRDKYLRVRFEDFATNPIKQAEEIYKFVGLNMTREVKSWLIESTSDKHFELLSRSQPLSIKRNPNQVLSRWRKELTYKKLRYIQEKCFGVLQRLNYKIYSNEKDFRDTSISHFVPKYN